MGVGMSVSLVKISLFTGVAVIAIAIGGFAAADKRNYDTAVICKAFSLLAKNASDEQSQSALTAIQSEIQRDSVETGRTAEQANADVEYSRFDWKDSNSDQTFFDTEWSKCVSIWSP